MRILMIFASILAFKTLPKNRRPSTFFRHFPQDTSKMPPRRPKMPPRHLQDAPKTLQEASKTALRPPKTSPRRLWTAQRRLQVASDCSETLQRVLQDWKIWKNCEFLVIFVRFLTRNSKASSSLPASSTLESHVSPSPPAQEIINKKNKVMTWMGCPLQVWGGFAPPVKNRGVLGAVPPSQKKYVCFSKIFKKIKNSFFRFCLTFWN